MTLQQVFLSSLRRATQNALFKTISMYKYMCFTSLFMRALSLYTHLSCILNVGTRDMGKMPVESRPWCESSIKYELFSSMV